MPAFFLCRLHKSESEVHHLHSWEPSRNVGWDGDSTDLNSRSHQLDKASHQCSLTVDGCFLEAEQLPKCTNRKR